MKHVRSARGTKILGIEALTAPRCLIGTAHGQAQQGRFLRGSMLQLTHLGDRPGADVTGPNIVLGFL